MNYFPATNLRYRRSLSVTAAILSLFASRGVSASDKSLADSVPADIGLFVEVRGAGDLLTSLTEPQIWSTLAELAGQPARPEDVTRWRERIRQTVRMNPDEAIRILFAGGVAFLGEGAGRAQDAVVACRPAKDVSTRKLLRNWQAKRLDHDAGNPALYQLHGNIGTIESDGLLFFGDLLPPNGLLRQVQHFAANPQRKKLSDDPVYRKLLARMPANPDGVLFARLSRAAPLLMPTMAPTSQPASRPSRRRVAALLPEPLRNSNNIMVALHREGPLLHFTAVGDVDPPTSPPPEPSLRFAARLPERTLLAWEGPVDHEKLVEVLTAMPRHGAVETIFQLNEQADLLKRFASALGKDTCIAFGPVSPGHRAPDAPPMPALALLIHVRNPDVVAQELRRISDLCVAGYSMFALARGVPPLPAIREVTSGSAPAHVLDLSPLLKPTAKQAIGEVQFCWTVQQDALIIASHIQWLRSIVAARAGTQPSLADAVHLPRELTKARGSVAFAVQTGPIADIGAMWLEYLRRVKPEAFDEGWWRERQPGGGDVRLGVTVNADAAHHRLRVDRVFPNQPAHGRLVPGDFIVGYDNRRFATDDPIGEIQKAIRERPHARWMELLVERKGRTFQKRLPVPFVNPIEALQRVVAIGRIAQRAVYLDDISESGIRGLFTIELRQSKKPLYTFPSPPAKP